MRQQAQPGGDAKDVRRVLRTRDAYPRHSRQSIWIVHRGQCPDRQVMHSQLQGSMAGANKKADSILTLKPCPDRRTNPGGAEAVEPCEDLGAPRPPRPQRVDEGSERDEPEVLVPKKMLWRQPGVSVAPAVGTAHNLDQKAGRDGGRRGLSCNMFWQDPTVISPGQNVPHDPAAVKGRRRKAMIDRA